MSKSNDQNEQLIADYMSKDFIQHNPTIADGPEGVKALVQMLVSKGIPKQKIEFKHIIAEGDILILHSRYEMAGKEWRFIDIYRVESDKIVEHWDAMMAMPEKRANNIYNHLDHNNKIKKEKVYVAWLGESEDAYDLHFHPIHPHQNCVDIWVQTKNANR